MYAEIALFRVDFGDSESINRAAERHMRMEDRRLKRHGWPCARAYEQMPHSSKRPRSLA